MVVLIVLCLDVEFCAVSTLTCTFSYFWLNLGNLVATCFRYVFVIYVPDF